MIIGVDNARAAERMYTTIEEQAALVVKHPGLVCVVRKFAPSARMLVKGVYLILCETHPGTDEGPIDEVKIVRVVHGHRDLSGFF